VRFKRTRWSSKTVNVDGYTNYRRFLLRHLTKSSSSKVTSRPPIVSSLFYSSSRYDNQWRPLAYTMDWPTQNISNFRYYSHICTSADKIHTQQFQFWLLNSLSQRDYLNTFYISYVFLHMSNFGNFIFRDNAIANRIISISFRFDAAEVNCGRRLCVVNVLHRRWSGSFLFRLVSRRSQNKVLASRK